MIKKILPGLTIGLILLLIASQALAVEGTRSGSKLDKSLISRACKYIDVNTIRSSVMNNGTFTRHPISTNQDMEWPKGSGKYICYNAGIWIAGKVNDVIRTACADYNVEYQPGKILEDGTPDDPEKADYRVFKVHKDYPDGDAALDIDTWDTWKTIAELQGAPPVSDAEGKWIGFGDEMLYSVMNDLNQTLHGGCYQTLPIGVELHLLVFAFDRAGALGNSIFSRYTLINKGENDLQEAYIGAWADVDNGGANDDLIGYDLNLGMSYCYGGKAVDDSYGPRPPALGWDFLQGPIVDSPGDTVILPDGRVFPNKKKLDATSFNKYYNSNSIYSDPPYSATGAQQVWNYLAGTQKDGAPWTNPLTGEVTTFVNTGDPVTGEGWLSTREQPPDDIRMLTGSGPFTLAVGDTQEIVLGCIIGQGSNRLSSITVLRFYDQAIQQAYDLGFQVPSPPPAPAINVSELDRKVLVTWEKNAEDFESSYEFEGYNVYVGASPAGPWRRLATYDLANELGVILEPSYDESSGEILNLPSALGNNLGTRYNYLFTKDYNDIRLANGRTYYFLVTSYAYDPTSLPNVLESSKNVIYAVPHQGRPGTVVTHDAFEVIPVEHTKGDASPSKYQVWVKIIDPLNVSTADYKISINADKTWTLWRNGVEVPEYTNVATYGIDENIDYKTLEGEPLDFFIGLTVDFIQQTLVTWEPEMIGGDAALLNSLTSPYRTLGKLTDLAVDGQYRKGTRSPELINNSLQIRFTGVMDTTTRKVVSGGSLATLLFSFGDPANFMPNHPENPNPGSRNPFLVRVPFEIWDVARNKQLNIAFTDNAQKIADADFVPTWAPRGKCVVYTVASEYDEQIHNIMTAGTDTMATWSFIFDETADWKTDDVVQLNIPDPDLFPKPVVPGVEEFSFRIQGETDGVIADAKERLDIINVYPNPYLAYNISETGLHRERVTFINLPATCTIRIFAISGQLVRTIEHNATSSNDVTRDWDLRNENNLPVASGFYFAYIDAPGVGEKILKLAIVFRQQRLRNL